MKSALPPAVILVLALAAFLHWGPPAFAARDQARADLAARERDLLALQRELSLPAPGTHEALVQEHAQLTAAVERQAAALAPTQDAGWPRLDALLASATGSLAPGSTLHAELRQLARLPADGPPPAQASPQERALARLLAVLTRSPSPLAVEALGLGGDGELAPLAAPAGWQRIEVRVTLAGPLPDLLRAIEQLSPGESGPAPVLSVTQASLRRIDPAAWSGHLAGPEAPPLRLALTLDALFPPAGLP